MVLFIKTVMDMSMIASIIILVVLVVRGLFSVLHVPKKFAYLLWILPFLRLICPFSVESDYSVMPQETPISIQASGEVNYILMDEAPLVDVQTEEQDSGNASAISVYYMLGIIWIAGVFGMLVYSMISYRRFKKELEISFLVKNNVYMVDGLKTACVIGYVRPRIYVPSNMIDRDMEYVIAHETTHIKRGDHFIKLLAFVIVTVHWFNPLCWLAYAALGKDMEMSCDEAVIKRIGEENKKAYANILLNMAMEKSKFAGMPLAFAEGDPKDRIKNIMKYKKQVIVISIVAAVAIVGLAIVLLTSPKSDKKDDVVAGQNASTTQAETPIQSNSGDVTDAELNDPKSTREPELDYSNPDDLPEGRVVMTAPVISNSPEGGWGADGVKLIYGSNTHVIAYGYMGLFVYSVKEQRLTGAVNVEKIGCNMTQGDNYTEVVADEKGEKVYLHNIKKDYMFVYDITSNTLEKQQYKPDKEGQFYGVNPFWSKEPMSEIMREQVPDIWIGTEGVIYENDGKKYLAYLSSSSGVVSDLAYTIVEWNDNEKAWAPQDVDSWTPYEVASFAFFENSEKYFWENINDDGLFARVTEVHRTRLTLEVYNGTGQEIIYGEEFKLYRYANDDSLEEIEFKPGIGFHEIAYVLEDGKRQVIEVDWTNIADALPDDVGVKKYRLVKQISIMPAEGDSQVSNDTEELAIDFAFPVE